MNLFKYHPNPEELLWNDRFISRREARKLILADEPFDKAIMGDLDLKNTPNLDKDNLPSTIQIGGELFT